MAGSTCYKGAISLAIEHKGMAGRRKKGADCSVLQRLEVTRAACLAIVASAAEVYPKECMGSICSLERPSKQGKLLAAFPYQIARRRVEEVSSYSSWLFLEMLSKGGPWIKIGDYHSHTYQKREKVDFLSPSEEDLNNMRVGSLEVIVRVKQTARLYNSWKGSGKGGIRIAWGRFRFLIKAFVRMPGKCQEGIPLYKTIRLVLSD